MKKIIFALFIVTILSACGSPKIYNSALKQIELGMTKEEVVSLMGKDYTVADQKVVNNQNQETIEYKDIYKNHWFFTFLDNSLTKWYKETEGQ